jgi:hypothetical protein
MPQSNAVMQCNGKRRKICSLKCHHTKTQQSKRQFQCIAEPKTDIDRSLSSSSKELPSSIVHHDPSLFVVYAMLRHARMKSATERNAKAAARAEVRESGKIQGRLGDERREKSSDRQ